MAERKRIDSEINKTNNDFFESKRKKKKEKEKRTNKTRKKETKKDKLGKF